MPIHAQKASLHGGAENAGVENTGAETYEKPSIYTEISDGRLSNQDVFNCQRSTVAN